MRPHKGFCAARPLLAFLGALAVLAFPAGGQQTIYHDAWLNSDFINMTGQTVNDFEIIVESPTFNPNQVLLGSPFPNYSLSVGDFNALHAGNETKITWYDAASIASVLPGQIAHVGMEMNGSGKILNAYWTNNGVPVPVVPGGPTSIAISYERTEVRTGGSGAIHMDLEIAPQYFADRGPSSEAGWTNLRVFTDIPAEILGLAQLNRSLDLATLSQYEKTPFRGVPGFPGNSGDDILLTDQDMMVNGVYNGPGGPDSFFDVFLDVQTDMDKLSPQYESLLHAQVLNQGVVIGEFWNLNPQSPEPSALMLTVVAAGIALNRRRLKP